MTDPLHHVTDEQIVTWLAGDLTPDHEDVLLAKFDKDPSVPGRIRRMRKVDELFRPRKRPEPIRERDRPDAERAARLEGLLESLEKHADESRDSSPDPTPLHRGPASDAQNGRAGGKTSWHERRDPAALDDRA